MALGAAAVIVVVVLLGVFARAGSDTSSTTRTTAPDTKPVPTSTSLPTAAQPGTGGMLPFSPSGFWNTPLPADAALAANSRELVRSFNNQWRTFYGTVGINTNDYSIPVYTVPADQPTVSVSISRGCNEDQGLLDQLSAVPIPDDARPANGGDHSLVIWQPATDTEWELWIAQHAFDGSWSACWGGRIQNVSKEQGAFQNPYGCRGLRPVVPRRLDEGLRAPGR